MKKLIIGFVGSLMLLTVSFAAPKDSTYSGEIMDSARRMGRTTPC